MKSCCGLQHRSGAGELTVPSNSAYEEGAHLSSQDVAWITQSCMLKVKLKASKTIWVGVDVFIGRTHCPLAAVLAYMSVRGSSPGPLFKFSNGTPLTRDHFVISVKEALARAGLDNSCYSGHSFCSGAGQQPQQQSVASGMPQSWPWGSGRVQPTRCT